MFLMFSAVVGKNAELVSASLLDFVRSQNGTFELVDEHPEEHEFCAIHESDGNTTVQYPRWNEQWYDASQWISEQLKAPVFALVLDDGDFWWFTMFVDGKIATRFFPLPQSSDSDDPMSDEISWNGDADIIARHVSYIKAADIRKYLCLWTDDVVVQGGTAYDDDVYDIGDGWQLLDFMRKLKLSNPGDAVVGYVPQYRLSPKPPRKNVVMEDITSTQQETQHRYEESKPWWKFWTRY